MAAGRAPVAVAAAVLAAAVIAWTAVPTWQNPWIATALAAAVVGWAVDRRPPGPLGVLAAAGPVAALGWSVYLLGAGPPGGEAGGAPLAAAGVLGALVLLARGVDHPAQPALLAFVLGSAVAALGFGLGRGTGPDAVAAAVAVLVAGSPVALLLVPPRTHRVDAVVVPAELLTTGELEVRAVHLVGDADEDAVRRFAAALHCATSHAPAPRPTAPHPVHPSDEERPPSEPSARADSAHAREAPRAWMTTRAREHRFFASRRAGSPDGGAEVPGSGPPPAAAPSGAGTGTLGRAVITAASGELPGVSDLDGRPDTGLRGVVSELHEDRVIAHAVLVGPPPWLAEHGVVAPDGIAPGALAVAWDGVARGWLEIAEAPRPGATAAIAVLRYRGVEVIPAAAPAPDGRKARDLAEVARGVRRQHRRVLLRRVCLVVTRAAAVGGAAAALVGLLNPATAVAVPVAAGVLVVAGTLRRHHPFGATA